MHSIEFLQTAHPEGPWCLTAITPDVMPAQIETRSFTAAQYEGALSWIAERNGKANLYWSVNTLRLLLHKKAQRQDILRVDYLHVDVDSSPTFSKEAILNQLTTNRPKDIPEPTILLDSGGGYQAFWKLETPIPINGDIARAEEAKLYNKQLELIFKGDNCHNVDRIMRLPGTFNIPNKKKRNKGRVTAEASVVSFHEWVYPLSDFKAAVGTFSTLSNDRVADLDIGGNIHRFTSLDELDKISKTLVPEKTKDVIFHGRTSDEMEYQTHKMKGDDVSRSGWLFRAVLSLVRCGVPDEAIYSIITDPEYKISESVLELGSAADRYAKKQISSARKHNDDPDLERMNSTYAVISNHGGRGTIMSETYLPGKKIPELNFMDPTNFNFMLENQFVMVPGEDGKPARMPIAKWWRLHKDRRQYDKIEFEPLSDNPTIYNLWRGFSYDAIPGAKHESYLEHVRTNICGGDLACYDYLIGWMANLIQNPRQPGYTAVVLRGGQGVGKGFFVTQFGALLGLHFQHFTNSDRIVGRFNDHLQSTLLAFADEACFAGDRKVASALKTLITEETLMIEGKGQKIHSCNNYVHLIMTSNDDHVTRIDSDDRRYFVLEVARNANLPKDYFGSIAADLKAGGYQNLLHFLRSYDLANFSMRAPPGTIAKKNQAEKSLSKEQAWWLDRLMHGTEEQWPEWIDRIKLREEYLAFSGTMQKGGFFYSPQTLRSFLEDVTDLPLGDKDRLRPKLLSIEEMDPSGFLRESKKQRWCFKLGSQETLRATWDRLYPAMKQDWPMLEKDLLDES